MNNPLRSRCLLVALLVAAGPLYASAALFTPSRIPWDAVFGLSAVTSGVLMRGRRREMKHFMQSPSRKIQ